MSAQVQDHRRLPAMADGPADCAFGVDGRGRADALPLARSMHHRSLSTLAPLLAVHRIGPEARFVPKADLRTLLARLCSDGRVGRIAPVFDGLWTALIGPLQRLLGSQPQPLCTPGTAGPGAPARRMRSADARANGRHRLLPRRRIPAARRCLRGSRRVAPGDAAGAVAPSGAAAQPSRGSKTSTWRSPWHHGAAACAPVTMISACNAAPMPPAVA